MSPQAANKYGSEIKENGLIIIDSSLISDFNNEKARVVEIPITKLAKEDVGNILTANILALSAVVGLTKVVDFEYLKEAVLNRIPKGTEELNIKAMEIGWQWAEKHVV